MLVLKLKNSGISGIDDKLCQDKNNLYQLESALKWLL